MHTLTRIYTIYLSRENNNYYNYTQTLTMLLLKDKYSNLIDFINTKLKYVIQSARELEMI